MPWREVLMSANFYLRVPHLYINVKLVCMDRVLVKYNVDIAYSFAGAYQLTNNSMTCLELLGFHQYHI